MREKRGKFRCTCSCVTQSLCLFLLLLNKEKMRAGTNSNSRRARVNPGITFHGRWNGSDTCAILVSGQCTPMNSGAAACACTTLALIEMLISCLILWLLLFLLFRAFAEIILSHYLSWQYFAQRQPYSTAIYFPRQLLNNKFINYLREYFAAHTCVNDADEMAAGTRHSTLDTRRAHTHTHH